MLCRLTELGVELLGRDLDLPPGEDLTKVPGLGVPSKNTPESLSEIRVPRPESWLPPSNGSSYNSQLATLSSTLVFSSC